MMITETETGIVCPVINTKRRRLTLTDENGQPVELTLDTESGITQIRVPDHNGAALNVADLTTMFNWVRLQLEMDDADE